MGLYDDTYLDLSIIYKYSPEKAKRMAGEIHAAQGNPASPYYQPYSQPTNQAVSNLQALGVDTTQDNWYDNYSWLTDYYHYSGTSNTPSSPGKKASKQEKAAYEYWQYTKSRQDTEKAKAESAQLKEDLTFLANWEDRNMSDQQIMDKIDWSKYSTLSKMRNNLQNGLQMLELNEAVDYSDEWMHGVIWAARNNGGTGNTLLDVSNAMSGYGNQWHYSDTINGMFDPESDSFLPYAAGSTNLDDAARFFGVYRFDSDWLEKNNGLQWNGTEEQKKYYKQVQEAEAHTQAAESAVDALNKWIGANSGKWNNYEDAKSALDTVLNKGKLWISEDGKVATSKRSKYTEIDLSILNKMDLTIGKDDGNPLHKTGTGDLISMTRGVNYKYADILNQIDGICNTNSATGNGDDFANRTNGIVTGGYDDLQQKSYDSYSKAEQERAERRLRINQQREQGLLPDYSVTEQTAEITKAQDEKLNSVKDIIDTDGTEAEKAVADNMWSVTTDRTKNMWMDFVQAGMDVFTELAESGKQNIIATHVTDTLGNFQTMYDYDMNEQNLAAWTLQAEELEKKLGMAEYYGATAPEDKTKTIQIGENTYRVTIVNDGDEYYLADARIIHPSGQESVVDPELRGELNGSDQVNEFIREYNEKIQKIDLANTMLSFGMTDEMQGDIEQLRVLRAQIEDAEEYQQKNAGAYQESKTAFDNAQRRRDDSIYMLNGMGIDTTDLEIANEVVGYLTNFSNYEATVWSAYNPSDAYRIALAEGVDKDAVYAAAKEGNDKLLKDLEDAKAVKQYIEDNGLKVPDNYIKNLDRHIAKLERDIKDYEYFALSENEDFQAIAQAGRDKEYEERPQQWSIFRNPELDWTEEEYYQHLADDSYDEMSAFADYGLRGIAGMFTRQMTEDEKDIYYYLIGKGDKDAAVDYVSSLTNMSYGALHSRYTDELKRQTAQMIGDGGENTNAVGFIGANILSVLSSPVAAMASLGYLGYSLFTGEEINPDNAMLAANNFRTTTREQSAKAISNYYGDGTTAQKLVQGFYEIVSNRLDSAMNGVVFGGLGNFGNDVFRELFGASPMGLTAAMDAMMEAKRKGASDEQAYGIGLVTFMAETGTEAISLDNMKSAFKIGQDVTEDKLKGFLKNWLKKAGISEMLGETANDLIENYWDEKIMGELSNHSERVWYYRTHGYEEEDAEAMARKEELQGVLHTMLISYLSPGLDVVSYAAGRANYYRQVTKQAQKSGDNRSMVEIIRGEMAETKAAREAKNAPVEESGPISDAAIDEAMAQREERLTNEKLMTSGMANGEGAFNLTQNPMLKAAQDAVAEQNRQAKERADQEAARKNADNLTMDYEILESAKGADISTQTASISAVLDTEGTAQSADASDAAAVRIGDMVGTGESSAEWMQDIMLGATVDNIDAASVKSAIRTAAIAGKDSAVFRVTQTDTFQKAAPNRKAQMILEAGQLDVGNTRLQDAVAKTIYENRIANAEKGIILEGALDGTRAAQDAADNAAAAVYEAEELSNDRQDALKAAQDNLQTINDQFLNDPSDDNLKQLGQANSEMRAADAVAQEYAQHLVKAQKDQQQADAELKRVKDEAMAKVRQQAEEIVRQEDQERAQVAEQEAVAQQEAEQKQAVQEQVENAAVSDADAFIEQNYADATDEEKQKIREAFTRIAGENPAQVITTDEQGQLTPEAKQNRDKFVDRVSKKFGIQIDYADTQAENGFYSNGYYDRTNNRIVLDNNATMDDAVYFVLGHELTHVAENSGTYTELANTLLHMAYGADADYQTAIDNLQKNNGKATTTLEADILQWQSRYNDQLGQEHTYEYALQELVADYMGTMINQEDDAKRQELVDRLVAEDPNVARRVLDSIKRFMKQMLGMKGAWVTNTQKTVDLLDKALKQVQKQNKGEGKRYSLDVNEATPLVTDDNGNDIATELPGGTVALNTETKYSLSSFTPAEQQKVRQALLDSGRFSREQVDQYLNDALGIASVIAADRERLDFTADPTKTMLKPNAEYVKTLDASTLCAKRLVYQGTFDAIQHALPNTPLMPVDLINLANMMREMGYESPCGICYVESRRRNLGKFADEWLKNYQGEYKPTLDQVTTTDGLEELRTSHPDTYQDFVSAMNKKGTMNPKVVQLRTDYRGEIRDMTPGQIQKVKDIGGLRVQSFSDFETPHLLDMTQAVMDMASAGLTSQAYTKVPNFAWVFGDTGIKINLSLIGEGTGVDENGNLVFDNVEGMNFDEAMKLRNRYSQNVGTILVGINDDHIKAAMADDRIDFIIPFHKSGWSKEELNNMPVLNSYSDYTDSQNEKTIVGMDKKGGYKTESLDKSKKVNFQPVGENGYWDFTKTGKENAETYLKMCAEDKRLPKFSQFLVDNGDGSFSLQPDGSTDGYWKTLIDFKMYDNDGNGAPQQEVTPNINMPEAMRVLGEFDGKGVDSLPVAQPVVDRYVEEYKANNPDKRYSLPAVKAEDAAYLSAVEHGDMENAQKMVEEAAKNAFPNSVLIQDGKFYPMWHHTNAEFNEFLPGTSESSGGLKGIYFTPQEYSSMSNLGDIHKQYYLDVKNPKFAFGVPADRQYVEMLKERQKGVADREELARINREFKEETGIDAFFDWQNGWYNVMTPEQIKSADAVTYDNNGNVIPLSERFNTQTPDIRYSLPSDSLLEQQIRHYLANGGSLNRQDNIAMPLEGQNILMSNDQGPSQRQFGQGMLQESDEVDRLTKAVVAEQNSYFPDTNEAQINRAIQWIRSNKETAFSDGFYESLQKVTSDNFDYMSADGQARMIATMAMAVARKDTMAQVQIADAFNRQGTDLGRAFQARKLFRLMTPAGRQSMLQNMLKTYQNQLDRKGVRVTLKLSDAIYQAAAEAQSEDDFKRVRQAAATELGKQIPATWKDRLRSLRMLSMLANPRTHIRNIVGNALFIPAVGLKNKLGALVELATVENGNRTKTLAPILSSDARNFARQDANNIKGLLTGEAKYEERGDVKKAQKTLGYIGDKLADWNSKALEGEDWIFLKGHYRRALGGWMMANGYTANQLQNDQALLEKGRTYAINEAKKATYRDFSKAAQILNQVSQKGGLTGFIVDATLPFKKTPANILRRGIEYSPAGIAKGLWNLARHMNQYLDYQNGKIKTLPDKAVSPTQVIDQICSGLSGTAVAALGFLLAGTGAVSCGLDDDEDKLEKAKGGQEYAVNFWKAGNKISQALIGKDIFGDDAELSLFGAKLFGKDVTMTMDWAAPMSMPFFVGAAVRNLMGDDGSIDIDKDLNGIINAFGNITEPVFNLSMLDGINSVFKTSQYDDTNTLTQIGAKVVSNYVSSYVPSVLGAVARLLDDKQRKAFVKSGEGTGVTGTFRYVFEQFQNKIPGWNKENIAVRDIWGNEKTTEVAERILENFILPGYINNYEEDPIINEMARLYDATGDKDMIPKEDPDKKIGDKALEDNEWDHYKEVRNKTAFNTLTDLINSPVYQEADDNTQVQMIKEAWDYATNVGKSAIVPEIEVEQMGDDIAETIAENGKITSYKNQMVSALDKEDYEGFETYVQALRDLEVEDSTIKQKIQNKYINKYKTAYRLYMQTENEKYLNQMEDIEEILDIVSDIAEFDFDFDAWKEKVDEKYNW